MLRFTHVYESPLSADALFLAHRDDLQGFGPKLPGVKGIQRHHREESGAVQVLEHRWQGDVRALPGILRFVVPSQLFQWQDHTHWNEQDRTGRWTVRVPNLGEMVKIEGTHRFEPLTAGARVHIEGGFHAGLAEALGGEMANAFLQRLFRDLLSSSETVIEAHVREKAARRPDGS